MNNKTADNTITPIGLMVPATKETKETIDSTRTLINDHKQNETETSEERQAKKEKRDDELAAKIICEIKDCKNPFSVICDEKISYFAYGWEPCGRKLCQDHYIDSSRCYSIPKTHC